MSLFVFAGSAQFVATGLVAGGAGLAIIILTTFVVNVRHGLYSMSLAPHVKNLPQRWLLPLGFWLTDETFLVVIERFSRPDRSPNRHWFYLGSAIFMYVNWQICTFIGIRAGQSIPDPQSWGLDFALPVTFIGMLVPALHSRPVVLCVVVAGSGIHRLPWSAPSTGPDRGHAVRCYRRFSRPEVSRTSAMTRSEALMILGMTVVTFGVRYPVLALAGRFEFPAWMVTAMKFIPPAVLTAIIVPAVLMPDGVVDFSYTNSYLVAAIIAALVAWRTNNLLLTIVVGMASLWLWRLVI